MILSNAVFGCCHKFAFKLVERGQLTQWVKGTYRLFNTIRAKTITPMNMMSNLVNIRRKTFSFLNITSILLIFCYDNSLSWYQGSVRLLFGGTTGKRALSAVNFLFSSHSHALSMIRANGSEAASSSVSSRRPSGASQGWPRDKNHRTCSGCGNKMQFCCSAATGFADRLRSILFNAPIPSGCTLMSLISL